MSVACRSLDDGTVRLGFSIGGVGEGVTGVGSDVGVAEGEGAVVSLAEGNVGFWDGAEQATRQNKIGSDQIEGFMLAN